MTVLKLYIKIIMFFYFLQREAKEALKMMIRRLKGKRKKDMIRTFCKISSSFQRSLSGTSKAFEEITSFIEENVFTDSDED